MRSVAEINREVGAAAARMGVPRPGYEQVRRLVHEARSVRSGAPTTVDVARDVPLGAMPVIALRDRLAK